MLFQISGGPDVQEIAQEPGVVEVQFRRPDQPFVEVPRMRPQRKDDVAGLQQGKAVLVTEAD